MHNLTPALSLLFFFLYKNLKNAPFWDKIFQNGDNAFIRELKPIINAVLIKNHAGKSMDLKSCKDKNYLNVSNVRR